MTLPISYVKAKVWPRKITPVLWGAGILVPPVLILGWIDRFAVNVPWIDEWEFIPLLFKLRAGEISFIAFLLTFHDVHRIVFPRLISYAAAFFPYDYLLIQMYVGFALKLLSLVFIWQLLKLTLKEAEESGLIWPLTLVASLLLFSAMEFENWTWAFTSVAWNLSLLCAIILVWLLASRPGRWTGTLAAALTAIIGTFTLAQGIILWGVGLVGIMAYGWLGKGRVLWSHLIFWSVTALVTVTLYFTGFPTGHNLNVWLFLSSPVDFGAFILVFLGAPFSRGPFYDQLATLTGLGGLAGLGVAAYWLSRYASIRPAIPWLLLAIYTLVTASFIATGRLGFGIEQATNSRYTNISTLFWVSALAVVCLAFSQDFRQRRPQPPPLSQIFVTTFLVIWLSLAYLASYMEGYSQFTYFKRGLTLGLSYLYNYETASDKMLGYLYWDPTVLREYARMMESLGLGLFSAGNPSRYLYLYAEPPIPAEAATGELVQGVEVTQTFVSRCKQLGRFDLLLATHNRVNTQPLMVRLTDETTGQVVYEQIVPGPDIEDKQWRQFVFEPLPGSALKAYRISLLSPTSQPGDAITIWHSRTDVYASGELLVNGNPTGVDLVFRYGCAELPQGTTRLDLAPGFPPSISQATFTRNNQSREALAAHPPSSLVWPLTLPAGKTVKLRASLALNPALGEQRTLSDGATFHIYVDTAADQSKLLLSQHVDPNQTGQGWTPVEVELSQYAGQAITLRLETGPGPANDFNYDWAGWVTPIITVSP